MRRLLFVMLAATMAAAATKTTSKLTTAGNVPMSPERYQYEQATKFNKAVDDIDTLMARVSGAANDSLGARELIVSDSGYIDTMTTAMGKATKLYVAGDSLKVTGLIACDTLAGKVTVTDTLRAATKLIVGGGSAIDSIAVIDGTNDTLVIKIGGKAWKIDMDTDL